MVFDRGFCELNKTRVKHSSFFVGDRLYVVGGCHDFDKSMVEMLDIGETDNPVCKKKWELINLGFKSALSKTGPLLACPFDSTQMLLFDYKRKSMRLYIDLYDTTQPLVK